MVVCSDGGGAVLAGRVEAFAVDQLSVGGIDRCEKATVSYHVNEIFVQEWRRDFRDATIEFPL